MLRQVLLHLLPFLLPFAAYVAYVFAMKKMEAQGGLWADAPWFWLTASGLALVIAGFVAVSLLSGAPPGAQYVPGQVKDGQVLPGRFE